jgi:hypothetical protein
LQLRDPAPRLEISGARNAVEAQAAVAAARRSNRKAGDVSLLALSDKVISEMNLSEEQRREYRRAGVRLISHNNLPSSRAELVELSGLATSKFSNVNVVISLRARLSPEALANLQSLSGNFTVEMFLLIDESNRIALRIVASELSRLVDLQRLVAAQA